jgi:hypothetical protein
MKFEIGNNVISSYKRLSYEAWYAFAEFVDNSTQAYFDNKYLLDSLFEKSGEKLKITIDYNPGNDQITIDDNSIGMDASDLDKALKVGQPPEKPNGRSKYGLGMKTAACWFGNVWKIKSKKYGSNLAYEVTIDVDKISKAHGDVDLTPEISEEPVHTHYTIITINNLNRQFRGRTLTKIREFLSSMYRFDFAKYGLELYWNSSKLEWPGFDKQLHVNKDGSKFKKEFEFTINEKVVKGWVGVLGKGYGSRKNAGFSIIQNDRVIQGWPNSYKPSSIFGEQEDGSNDLVNQRVIGELILDQFSVSHTKDKIAWEDNEEEQIDIKLGEFCQDARNLALTLRYTQENAVNVLAILKQEALNIFESELKSDELINYIKTTEPYPETIIEKSYYQSAERIKEESDPSIEVSIGSDPDAIHVLVFLNEKSEFEPYVLTETTIHENKVIIIVNSIHPHVQDMTNSESFLNFIRHCVYDGVAEWKAVKLRGSIQPFTIKFLKDGLLRIPFEIRTNQSNSDIS